MTGGREVCRGIHEEAQKGMLFLAAGLYQSSGDAWDCYSPLSPFISPPDDLILASLSFPLRLGSEGMGVQQGGQLTGKGRKTSSRFASWKAPQLFSAALLRCLLVFWVREMNSRKFSQVVV